MSKITDAAKGKPCIRCGVEDGTVCSRHYNGIWQQLFGKGRGIKCDDLMTADFCIKCDADFTEGVPFYFDGKPAGDYVRAAFFMKYVCLTNIRRRKEGTIDAGK